MGQIDIGNDINDRHIILLKQRNQQQAYNNTIDKSLLSQLQSSTVTSANPRKRREIINQSRHKSNEDLNNSIYQVDKIPDEVRGGLKQKTEKLQDWIILILNY